MLDPHQNTVRNAIVNDGGNLRVVAAAGSGKTHTLVHTIKSLHDRGVPAHDIIATTFTSKAGKEMKERLQGVLPASYVEDLRVGTFHGLALRSLRGMDPNRWNMRNCLVVPGRNPGIPHHKSLWNSILTFRKDGVWGTGEKSLGVCTKSEVKSAILAVDVMRSRGLEWGTEEADLAAGEYELVDLWKAWGMYVDAKDVLGAFDFSDVLQAYLDGLHSGAITDGARYVFVDEAQDNSKVQLDIARQLARKGRLILIGDGRQAIYSWRGAEPGIFLGADIELNAASLPIPRNYRSKTHIVAVSNAVADGADWALGVPAEAFREESGELRTLHGETLGHEASLVAEEISDAMATGRSAEDFAILCRTNASAAAFEGALMIRRIPVARIGGQPFWEGRTALAFLAYAILSEVESWPALERIYNVPEKPKRYLGRAFLKRAQGAVSNGVSIPLAIRSVIPSLRGGSKAGARMLADIIDELRGLPWDRRVYRIAQLLRPPDADAVGDDDDESLSSVCAAMARNFSNATELVQYADACTRNTLAVSEGKALPAARVTICTVHRSKGLEWPTVYVSASQGTFPHSRALAEPGRAEEERRLFYVAVSRARDELIVSSSNLDEKGARSGPSIFTERYVEPFIDRPEVSNQGAMF